MALDSIGSVSVDIRGDYSRLQADFAGAQALAAKAGSGIATALNTGMAPAAAQAGVVLDKYGLAFRSVTAEAAKTGAAITTGLTAPTKAAKPAVEDLGASIRKMFQDAAAGQQEHSVALGHGATQIQAVGGALRTAFGEQSIRAVERFLTMIPGIGPLLQKAFPLIGAIALIDMFSRVMSKSDGVKQAMQELKTAVEAVDKAFADLVKTGDQLMTHAMTRDTGAAAGAQQRANQLRREAHDLDNRILEKESEIRNAANQYNAEHPGEVLFKGTLTGPQYESEEVGIKRAALNKEIDKLRTDQEAKLKEANSAELDAAKDKHSELGGLDLARIVNQKSAGDKASELLKTQLLEQAKLEHDAVTQRIAGLESEYQRTVQTGNEEIRYAKAKQTILNGIALGNLDRAQKETGQKFGAESQGKSTEEVDKLRINAQGELANAQADYKKETVDSENAVSDAVSKSGLSVIEMHQRIAESMRTLIREGWEKLGQAADQNEKQVTAAAGRLITATVVASEIEAKSKGDLDALNTLKQKIQLEGTYANQLSHSKAQEIQYARDLAQLDSKARQDRIAGEEKKLAPMVAELPAAADPSYEAKYKAIKELEAQIAELRAKANNDDLAALNTIDALVRKLSQDWQLGHEIKQTLEDWKAIGVKTAELQTAQAALQVPAALGGAIAGGIFNQGKQGMDIGKQIGDAMKNIGKQLLGEVLTDILKRLLEEMIAHTALQAAMNLLIPTTATGQTAALLVGLPVPITSGILAANAITTGVDAGASGVAAAGGGLAAGAGGAASSAASGLIGPLIAAAGGIIGGVISGVMSLIGAHQIVTAIHGTTAAVQALHGTVSGTSGPVTSGVPSAPAASTGGASQGGLMGFFSSILGFGSSSKPIDVNVVAFSPISPLKGLFNLFGFASGGRPPMGMASIVGEKGPELFIPDQAGTVIPAGKWGGMAPGLPSISGVSSTSHSIGSMSFTVNGVTNPKEFVRQVARELPGYLKSTGPGYSPASR